MKISIIIPARNEANYIADCINSLKRQKTKYQYEIIVADGMSEDNTKEIAEALGVKVIDNQKRYTPFGLNLAVKESKGDIIIRADAHSIYDENYMDMSVAFLDRADIVGGKIIPIPKVKSPQAIAIIKCLSSWFGVGSDFRKGENKTKYTDTAFGGCYKKSLIDKIGGYDERLIRSQDIEFCQRAIKKGYKVLYSPLVKSYYYPKTKLWDFFKHNIQDGIWATYILKYGIVLKRRHYLPLALLMAFPLTIIPYLLINLTLSIKEQNILLPIAFICRHFGYGIGCLIGLIKN